MIMPSATLRDAIIEHLKRSGIMAVFHYVPLHESQWGNALRPTPPAR
jgi:hypothetical protein